MSLASVAITLVIAIFAARFGWLNTAPGPEPGPDEADEPIAFLFQNGVLSDASPPGRILLDQGRAGLNDWDRLAELLTPRFCTMPATLPNNCNLTCHSRDPGDTDLVKIEAADGILRLSVVEPSPMTAADRHMQRLRQIEESRLRGTFDQAPFLIWITDALGQVQWSNESYRRFALRAEAGQTDAILSTGLALPRNQDPVSVRVETCAQETGQTDPQWFDVTVQRAKHHWLHYATNVTPIIRVKKTQRGFVQTLTKTFALLSIGLCVFDCDRSLTLFNPAMIDLTGLKPEFLSSKPSLAAFFDALRDRQVMPEPKNYLAWRDAISDLDTRATAGNFQETWSLPGGATYRVTGRPYPNGAIAFLFENISAEIGASRRFHESVQLAQSVMDSVEESLAVFSRQGRLVMCNAAYRALWNTDTGANVGEVTIQDATRIWQKATQPNPAWGDVRDFVGAFGPRAEWQADARLVDGSELHCRFVPLKDGATLAGFSTVSEYATQLG
ncbi:PAS-domain containing protein [Pseudooceanicola sp.]|uniref:PAS-domain containing protein n=1 Tax=Pseudooceanicola sp. TaxID=1914328 RepID=UPI0026380069|nr:PAS-domain containing protein [Pseudooceanicola sp.]